MPHRFLDWTFVLLAVACACVPVSPGGEPGTVAITNVTVIDVTAPAATAALAGQTVIVEAGRIRSVTPTSGARLPHGAEVIDGTGRYLVPGLWDYHAHLTVFGESALPLLASQGITSIRDVGGDPAEMKRYRAAVSAETRIGPRIFFAGRILESPAWLNLALSPDKPHPIFHTYDPFAASPRTGVADSADAEKAIQEIRADGADFIKLRTSTPEGFRAIAAEAHRRGLPLVGHPPTDMDLGAAAEAGLYTVEHMGAISSALGDKSEPERMQTFERMARAGTGITPTLITSLQPLEQADVVLDDEANRIDSRRRYLSPEALAAWRFHRALQKLGFAGSEGDVDRQLQDLRLARQAGVAILVGTDASSVPLIYPGYAVHEELRLLVEQGGLTPLEALRGATFDAARLMGDPGSGRIAAGQRGDLLLLNANPLTDIGATRRIEAVVLHGRVLDREGLDALREQSAALAGPRANQGPTGGGAAPETLRPDLAHHFEAWDLEGSFVLLADASGEWTLYNPERAGTGVLPASTFKVFNTLAALETGAAGVDEVIPWDGVERGVAGWNEDQAMRQAFQRSTVWLYQEVARRIGLERMRALLEREGYGNRNPGGGIDQFWLTGDLRISAREQVAYLKRIRDREVGFPPEAVAQVEELLIMARCADPAYVFRGKTGWARAPGLEMGWLVGWVETGSGVHFYALNVETDDPQVPMVRARPAIVRGILDELGLLALECGRSG
jgi:beta-lactamase class D